MIMLGNTYDRLLDEASSAGLIVWWRLLGSCSHEQLSLALAAIGMVGPNAPTPECALKRAVADVGKTLPAQRGQVRMARRADKLGRKVALVAERRLEDAGDLDYDTEIRAWLDVQETVVTGEDGKPAKEKSYTLQTSPYTPEIHQAYDKARDLLLADDVALWLVRRAILEVEGIPLRDTGGVYFVPGFAAERWRQIATVVTDTVGIQFFGAPTVRCADTVEGILDALTEAVYKSLEKYEKKVKGDAPSAVLERWQGQLSALHERVARYEGLLATSAQQLHAAISRVEDAECFAALASLGEADVEQQRAAHAP